jgi:LruC domain-containing protein
MKTTTKKVMALAIFSSTLLFSGCQKDLYDPEYAASKNGLITGVPSDFNWSTISSVNLTVNVDDQYNGEFYYIVEVYNNNPLFSSDSKLLAKGVAKKGQAFTSTVTTPQGLSTLYVCQTNPLGFKEVKAVDVSSVNLACNFGSVSTKSSAVSTRSVAYRSTSFTYPTYSSAPSNAVVIDSNTASIPWYGGVFVVKGDYNGGIKFPGAGNTTVYVEGKWTNTASNITLQDNTNIIILNGGEFATSKSMSITGNGNATLVVMPGGKFNASKDQNIDINFTTNGAIINQGIFNMQDMSLPSQASLHNNGTMTMAKLTISSSTNTVVNDKTLTASEMNLTNGVLTNNDAMTVTGTITSNGAAIQNNGNLTVDKIDIGGTAGITNNCNINVINQLYAHDTQFALGSNSLLQSKNLDASAINVELKGASIFNITNEANFKGAATFKGLGPNFALVRMEKTSIKQWNEVYYKDYVKVETNSHPNNSVSNGNSKKDYYTLEGVASISKIGQSGINIAASDCTGQGATTTDNEDPSSPTFPIVVPTNTSYTYAMEDLWPNYGDYDMNDIVVTVSTSSTINSSNKVLSMTINADLRAIGADKSLGAAFQLDKVAAGSVSGITYSVNSTDGSVFELSGTKIEAGQTQAVIPLFDNAHDFLGSSGITNTVIGGKTVPSKSVTIVITFNENAVSQDDIDVKNLNFFIVADKQKTNRTEIHLKGYQATDKANTTLFGTGVDNSNGTAKYTSKDNLVWGIMLPTTFNYPVEHISILDAYPDFKAWAISGGTQNTNWYDTPNNTSIYK